MKFPQLYSSKSLHTALQPSFHKGYKRTAHTQKYTFFNTVDEIFGDNAVRDNIFPVSLYICPFNYVHNKVPNTKNLNNFLQGRKVT
jgi:hypothetical protein